MLKVLQNCPRRRFSATDGSITDTRQQHTEPTTFLRSPPSSPPSPPPSVPAPAAPAPSPCCLSSTRVHQLTPGRCAQSLPVRSDPLAGPEVFSARVKLAEINQSVQPLNRSQFVDGSHTVGRLLGGTRGKKGTAGMQAAATPRGKKAESVRELAINNMGLIFAPACSLVNLSNNARHAAWANTCLQEVIAAGRSLKPAQPCSY